MLEMFGYCDHSLQAISFDEYWLMISYIISTINQPTGSEEEDDMSISDPPNQTLFGAAEEEG